MFTAQIAYHAAHQPRSIAVVLPANDVTYEKFNGDINAVAHRLLAVLPRGPVVVVIGDLYLHYAVVLALARLNILSASIDPNRLDGILRLVRPAAVIIDRSVESLYGAFEVRVSSDWLGETLAAMPRTPVMVPVRPTDPARIATSSGTTGRPKKIVMTHEMVIRRFKNGAIGHTGRPNERTLTLIGIDTAWGLGVALRTWWQGGAMAFIRANPDHMASRAVTHLAASPRQLQNVLDTLAPDSAPVPNLSVTVGGSKISRAASVAARLRLASSLTLAYGSAEAASVAVCPALLQDRDPQAVGYVLPWVEVQAVDETGRVLPPGETGELRIRSEEVVDGYDDDPEATARAFRDGWFHPGDIGSVSAGGVLRLFGRTDDIINIGGIKFLPEQIETLLAAYPAVSDSAVFAHADAQGSEQLWAAIVDDGTLDPAALSRELSPKVIGLRLPLNVVRVEAIPRNAMGKIERFKLPALVTDAAAMR